MATKKQPAKKPAPEKKGPKGWLNRAYSYGERHVATVALVALGLGIVLAAAALYGFYHEQGIETWVTREVARVESKCQRYGPRSHECHESFGTALKSLNETLTPVEARIVVCRSHLFDQLDACKKVRRIEAAESEPKEPSAPLASSRPSAPNSGKRGDATSTPQRATRNRAATKAARMANIPRHRRGAKKAVITRVAAKRARP